MYIPTRIYIKRNRSIEHISCADITPPEVYEKNNTEDTVIYLSVRDDTKNTKNMFDIDFGELITDTDIGSCTTWGEVAVRLTQALVLGYSLRLPGYVSGTDKPKRGMAMWNIMNTFKTFNISYADHLSKRADISAIKWALKDIRIQISDGAKVYPTLKNCLVTVNGMVCRPWYDEQDKYLYGLDGALYTDNDFMPELGVMDFTPVGKLTVERIMRSDSSLAVEPNTSAVIFTTNVTGTTPPLNLTKHWTFKTNTDLRTHTPIVVLAGCVIWPDEIIIDSEHTFRINFFNRHLNRIRAWEAFCKNEPTSEAAVTYKASPILEYLEKEFAKPKDDPSNSCFVAYVESSNVVINRKQLISWRSGISLDLYAPTAVLIRKLTDTIHTYHAAKLTDRQILTVQPFEELYTDTQTETGDEYLISEYDCTHADLMSVADSSYEMLYFLC